MWLAKEGKTLTVQWIPGHEGIKGNEIADKEARLHAKMPVNPHVRIKQSLSNARRQIRKAKDSAWQAEWENQRQNGAPLLYLELGFKPTSKRKKLAPQLSMRREVVGWLITARSRHGPLLPTIKDYSTKKRKIGDAPAGNIAHHSIFFGCANARAHRALLWSEKARQAPSTEEILSTSEGAAAFANWAPETGLFNRRFEFQGQDETDQ